MHNMASTGAKPNYSNYTNQAFKMQFLRTRSADQNRCVKHDAPLEQNSRAA